MVVQPRPGLVIAPSGVGEVLDLGFNLARRNYRMLLLTALWSIVPSSVLSAFSNVGLRALSSEVGVPSMLGTAGLGVVVSLIISVLGYAAVCTACARLIRPTGAPDEFSAGQLYGVAFRSLGRLILWGIVIAVLSIPLLIILPLGIYLYVRWSMSWISLIVESAGPIAALGRSWELTRGSWWHSVAVLGATGLIIALIDYALLGLLGGAALFAGFALGSGAAAAVLTGLVGIVSSAITTPFSMAIPVVLYFELRARAEGFDLEQRALQLSTSA